MSDIMMMWKIFSLDLFAEQNEWKIKEENFYPMFTDEIDFFLKFVFRGILSEGWYMTGKKSFSLLWPGFERIIHYRHQK